MIRKFFRQTLLVTLGSIFSLVIILIYKFTNNREQWFPGGDFLFNLASQLSLAFLSSYIFYIIQVYIPENKKRRVINKHIGTPVWRIVSEQKRILEHLAKEFLQKNNIEELTSHDYKKIFQSINLYSKAPVLRIGLVEGNYKEYMYNHIIKIRLLIKDIKECSFYVDEDLMDYLYELEDSKFLEQLTVFFEQLKNLPLNNKNLDFVKEYSESYFKIG